MRLLVTAPLLSAALALAPDVAAAQQLCAKRDQIVSRLEGRYGESRQGFGLQGSKLIVELFYSAETGSWTILATRPDGVACALGAGQGWTEQDDPTPAGPPA